MRNFVKIKKKHPVLPPVVGCLLVSDSSAFGDVFSRSVILLIECGVGGSMGLVLNKVSNISLEDAISVGGMQGYELFVGGPVDEGRLFCLHDISSIPGCKSLGNGLFVGGSLEKVFKVLQNKSLGYRAVFYSGYSGWSLGQLEAELDTESWVVVERNVDVLDGQMDDTLWRKLLLSLDDHYYTLWANSPKSPSRN